MKKSILLFTAILISTPLLFAESKTLTDYLTGWLENDRDLKSAAISLQKAELSNEKSQIQNGFDITLSSGNMTFKTVNGTGTFSVNPSVKVALPSASNLTLSADTDITISTSTNLENASLSAGIDILNTEKEKRQLTETKALRSVLEAKRQIEAKAQSSEKSFYSELRSLLKSSESITSSRTNLYSDKISFEKIKAQGYATTSSSYRLAEMKVNNDLHSIETSERQLNHDYELFLMKCGIKEDALSYKDFLKLLESEITEQEILTFDDFKKENYKSLENALWTQSINNLSRDADKNYSLKGNLGYTFNNTNAKDSGGKPSDTINLGLSSSALGMNLSAGVNIPVNPGSSPVFTAGISFSPNTLKLQKLGEKEDQLDIQSESISIETVLYNYDISAADKKQTAEDLLWTKQTTEENLSLYSKTESDMKYYFDRGIITESEYLSARNTKEKYEIEKTLNLIDIIISNCEVQSLFYTDN